MRILAGGGKGKVKNGSRRLVRVSGVGTCCVERSTLSCIIRFPGRHTTINDIPTIKDGEIHLWLLSSNFGTIQAKQHRGGCYYVPFYSSLWVSGWYPRLSQAPAPAVSKLDPSPSIRSRLCTETTRNLLSRNLLVWKFVAQ